MTGKRIGDGVLLIRKFSKTSAGLRISHLEDRVKTSKESMGAKVSLPRGRWGINQTTAKSVKQKRLQQSASRCGDRFIIWNTQFAFDFVEYFITQNQSYMFSKCLKF
ncbi:hypothetical protein NDU88_008168 [Pleurodeles waltl]|uniref:Uncharacterized protein n=1 Tax=Pleurodeles waltl TaxID=8319 RepID=A0AAV7QP50_PLEWA|nr:hypothetical protein NDU88_008168 [Pleurodeles waltl]